MTCDQTDQSEVRQALIDATKAALGEAVNTRLEGGLYVVATPIGNLGDITIRALATLARADAIYCEDTRHSGKLLSRYRIDTPLRVYEEHSAGRERPRVLAALGRGDVVALISDAGTPLISDPGYKLVRDAVAEGHHVVALPGACAAIAGLSVSGLATDSFHFVGFLPSKTVGRRSRLEELGRIEATLVFYESPNRIAAMLEDAVDVLGVRQAVVGRELTKLYEEIVRGPLDELAEWANQTPPRGEVVVLIDGPGTTDVSDEEIVVALQRTLANNSLKDAAREIAASLKVSRRRIYELGLAIRDGRDGGK